MQTVFLLWVNVHMTLYLIKEIMMAIPLQVLVSMCRLVTHFYAKDIVCLGFDQGIKKRDSPILLITFDSELYSWIYTVYMIQKRFLMGLLLDDPSVIHKPVPELRRVKSVPKLWRVRADLRASLSKCSMYRLPTIGLTGDP